MKRTIPLVAALVIAFAGLASAQTTHVVQVFNNFYTPQTVNIQVGDSVRWEWKAGVHTITNGVSSLCPNAGAIFDGSVSSGLPTFTFTFNESGKYDYFCRPHELLGMVGVVNVSGLSINGTPSAGNPVGFSVANLPSSDDGGNALVLLSISGTSPGIALPGGACSGTVDVRFDPITQLGLSIAPFLTTGTIAGGAASTFNIPLPGTTPVGLTVFFGGVVINGGSFGSILPTESVVTQ
ncbi:MAG: plastocyanin/azurin family copper-binding protein [Planctomycetota bacterium]